MKEKIDVYNDDKKCAAYCVIDGKYYWVLGDDPIGRETRLIFGLSKIGISFDQLNFWRNI